MSDTRDRRVIVGLAAVAAVLLLAALIVAIVGISTDGRTCGSVVAPLNTTGPGSLACERAVDDRRSLVTILGVVAVVVAAAAGYLWRNLLKGAGQ